PRREVGSPCPERRSQPHRRAARPAPAVPSRRGPQFSSAPLVIGMWTEDIKMAAVGFALSALLAWPKQLAVANALAKKFPVEYSTHGIAQYPRLTRMSYAHYALFLDELIDQEYSCEDVAKLSSFADIAKPPDMPKFQLSQHPNIMFLLGLCASLLVNLVTNSPTWK